MPATDPTKPEGDFPVNDITQEGSGEPKCLLIPNSLQNFVRVDITIEIDGLLSRKMNCQWNHRRKLLMDGELKQSPYSLTWSNITALKVLGNLIVFIISRQS